MQYKQEKITEEFSKIITGKDAFQVIYEMAELETLDKIIPEIAEMRVPHNSHYHTEVMEPFGNSILAHTLFVFKFTCERTDKLSIRLAALLHDIGKNRCRETKADGTDRFLFHDRESAKMAQVILKRMKFDNQTIDEVIDLVFNHMYGHNIQKMTDVAKIRLFLGRKNFDDLLILLISDTLGTSGHNGVPNQKEVDALLACIKKHQANFPEVLPAPFISGDDLIAAGKKPGPEFTKALKVAYDQQLRGVTDVKKLLKHAISTMK
jgi:tRNA nucleotidyltransferase (CCA-adding enzyme)